MIWSGSKNDRITGKWYRIKTTPIGEHEIMMADGQWDLEKGHSGDTFFTHYFQRQGSWLFQENIPYRFLLTEPQVRDGYIIKPYGNGEELSQLYRRLEQTGDWLVYLEERINDCELGMEWLAGQSIRLKERLLHPERFPKSPRLSTLREVNVLINDFSERKQKNEKEFVELINRLATEEGGTWSKNRFEDDVRKFTENIAEVNLLAQVLEKELD